jgi:hypothetical protein
LSRASTHRAKGRQNRIASAAVSPHFQVLFISGRILLYLPDKRSESALSNFAFEGVVSVWDKERGREAVTRNSLELSDMKVGRDSTGQTKKDGADGIGIFHRSLSVSSGFFRGFRILLFS